MNKKYFIYTILIGIPLILGAVYFFGREPNLGDDVPTLVENISNRAAQIKTEVENEYPDSVLKQRVENGLIFQRPDGKEEHRYSTGPWHWREKDIDPWIEIDTGIEDSGDAVWKHHIKSAKFDTFLTDDGQKRFYPRRWITNEYVEFGVLEWKVGIVWQPVPIGITSSVKNKFVGEDKVTHKLEIGFTGIGAQTNLTLKNSSVARPLRWKVDLVGLDWDKRVLVSQTDGKKVGFIRPPYLTDSSAIPEKHEIPWEYSNSYFTLMPDFKDAVFPVTIDPDYNIAEGGDDGNVQIGSELFSDTSTLIQMGNISGSPDYNPWLRFQSITATKDDNCTAATIAFVIGQNGNGTDMQMIIAGVDEDDHTAPTNFAEWNTDHGIHTTAVVHWDGNFARLAGETLTTDDFSDVIDELFARGGWGTGNDIGIHIDDDGSAQYTYRYPSSYENETYTEPVLSLTVEAAPPADTCSCPSPAADWYVNSSDNCYINTDCDLVEEGGSAYDLYLLNRGAGAFNIIDNAELTIREIHSTSVPIKVKGGAKINFK